MFQKGFTLLEILLVIAAIGILAAIVIVAINPNRQIAQVRDADRVSSSNSLTKALEQYTIDNGGYPTSVSPTETEVCATGNLSTTDALGGIDCTGLLDLRALVPTYLASIPVEPTASGDGAGYHVSTNAEVTAVYVKPSEVEAITCPQGYISVPGNRLYGTENFCVMKYEAKDDGSGNAISQIAGTPWVSISQGDAITECENSVGGSILTNEQWMTIARNIEGQAENWTGGDVGAGGLWRGNTDSDPGAFLAASTDDDPYFGTNDTDPSIERRTHVLSNGEVIWDFAGNTWEWIDIEIPVTNQPTGATPGAGWRGFGDLTTYGQFSYDEFAPSNNSWTTIQNIGNVFSDGDPGDTSLRGLIRGGRWVNSANGGIYAASFSPETTSGYPNTTFRCALTP